MFKMNDKFVTDKVHDMGLEITGVRWNQPQNYFNPLFFAGVLSHASRLQTTEFGVTTEKAITIAKLKHNNWPHYFLSPALCDVLDHTNIADNYPLDRLHWPFNALTATFAKGGMQTKTLPELDVVGMSISLIKRSEYHANLRGLHKYERFDRFSIVFTDTNGDVNTGTWPLASTFDEVSRDYLHVYTGDHQDTVGATDEQFSRMIQEMGVFSLKLLLFLNAKAVPKQGSVGSKRIKHKRTGWDITIRDPIVLDHQRVYRMADGSTQTGIKLGGHWRRGHFRGVWKGVGRTHLIDKWIEPYPVGSCREDHPEDDEQPQQVRTP